MYRILIADDENKVCQLIKSLVGRTVAEPGLKGESL